MQAPCTYVTQSQSGTGFDEAYLQGLLTRLGGAETKKRQNELSNQLKLVICNIKALLLRDPSPQLMSERLHWWN